MKRVMHVMAASCPQPRRGKSGMGKKHSKTRNAATARAQTQGAGGVLVYGRDCQLPLLR